jgi:hypothetical protein
LPHHSSTREQDPEEVMEQIGEGDTSNPPSRWRSDLMNAKCNCRPVSRRNEPACRKAALQAKSPSRRHWQPPWQPLDSRGAYAAEGLEKNGWCISLSLGSGVYSMRLDRRTRRRGGICPSSPASFCLDRPSTRLAEISATFNCDPESKVTGRVRHR